MNTGSLQKDFPEAKIIRPHRIAGYRRVFNFKSPYRQNPETGIFSSVLNISEDTVSTIEGLQIEIPDNYYEKLLKREGGYDQVHIEEHEAVITFISKDNEEYPYVVNDPIQSEYLSMCIQAAQEHGFLENFLNTTYSGDRSLQEIGLDKLLI